jgi:curved DNA-binding protein CbpA
MADDRDAYRVLQVDPEAHETVIRAAFRALAAMYHPDRDPSAMATRRMAELNDAFSKLRTRDRREAYDRLRSFRTSAATPRVVPVPAPAAPVAAQPRTHGTSAVKAGPEIVDFGRYAGWTIKQLARHDPDYLRWLSRHSSGIRFRRGIEAALADVAPTPAPAASKKGRR